MDCHGPTGVIKLSELSAALEAAKAEEGEHLEDTAITLCSSLCCPKD